MWIFRLHGEHNMPFILASKKFHNISEALEKVSKNLYSLPIFIYISVEREFVCRSRLINFLLFREKSSIRHQSLVKQNVVS